MTGYAELQVTTNYSFLRGASHPEELIAQAKLLGLPAIGITDLNSLAGIARCHQRAEEAGFFSTLMAAHDAGQGVSVCDADGRQAEQLRLRDQLLGMRSAAQEGVVGRDLQLGVFRHVASSGRR